MKTLTMTAIAAALLASPALSATVDVSKQNSSNVFADANGANKWYVAMSFDVGNQSFNNVGAGAFRVTTEDENGFLQDLLAFCLQPLEVLTLPKEHKIENPFIGATSDAVQALAANAWDLVTDAKSAGAFQMAVWEITTETNAYDIQSGTFKITSNGAGSNGAETLAQSWLDNITNGVWSAGSDDFMILTADGTQDLLTNTLAPIPLPASGLLLLGGLAGAGAMAKRRKKS
ncbi:MAG: VPLPA-CTERM sorting domain-containing protein [Litoreibacter sp.]|nr:VPLPA-CTERM sorting domain-containing protein [Litoreibacter sp.]